MEIFLIAVLIGLIPASIARSKGRSFGLWWFFGAALFIVALPAALLMKADASAVEKNQLDAGMKKCPFCAEMIKREASVCRFCGRDLDKSRRNNVALPVGAVECPTCGASLQIRNLNLGSNICPECQNEFIVE